MKVTVSVGAAIPVSPTRRARHGGGSIDVDTRPAMPVECRHQWILPAIAFAHRADGSPLPRRSLHRPMYRDSSVRSSSKRSAVSSVRSGRGLGGCSQADSRPLLGQIQIRKLSPAASRSSAAISPATMSGRIAVRSFSLGRPRSL